MGFLVSDEEGSVVSCCGVHIGTAVAEPDVFYTVIRRTDDTAAMPLGQLVNGAGESAAWNSDVSGPCDDPPSWGDIRGET
jgi:hypothetical protein